MNNMYYQGYGAPIGYAPAPRPEVRFTQPVTPEMSQMMLRDDDQLSVKISPIEHAKNMCTHKIPGQAQLALVEAGVDEDGQPLVACKVCGERFHFIMEDPESKDMKMDLIRTVTHIRDLMQSAKTMYVNCPEDFVKEYFQSMTLCNRLIEVYSKAYKDYIQQNYNMDPRGVYPSMNSFAAVNGLIGGAAMGGINPMYGGYQQPPVQYDQFGRPITGYAPQPQQPPVQYDQFGRPIAQAYAPQVPVQGDNPLMYSPSVPQAPAPATAPQAPAPGVNPQVGVTAQPVAVPGQPQQPQVQTGDITQTKAFSV